MGDVWDDLYSALDAAEAHFTMVGEDDHRPEEAVDVDGSRYCLGCEVGVKVQALRLAVDDYLAARGDDMH